MSFSHPGTSICFGGLGLDEDAMVGEQELAILEENPLELTQHVLLQGIAVVTSVLAGAIIVGIVFTDLRDAALVVPRLGLTVPAGESS